ncbi:sensor histidine kinase [Maribacter dokdonensis]|uniref:sensor histidine kinase n=1 Tax=Maribacter dokdonensis TaxID=320912 RepID=UPI001C0A3531|nr:histidine kinase dimerization/phosphoacceptor domain -containing protein [Maribacter dokdonensis]MBU2901591.1 tetratricopeptide repeat protein [Maribacter dokdonensis]MDP2527882.1 histidine kinase dimerization/phosphoacceptor domain -containing protein [Maribacter dokdonensis]
MKKPFILRFVCTIVLSVFMCTLAAQDAVTTQNEDYYKQFQDLENGELRSFFFFNTPNRYNQNSPYDWLDTVKVYLNSSEKTKDSISIRNYQLIESQIYYDLGNYEKSLAIARPLYDDLSKLDLDSKHIILDILDSNYAKLELYDKQIEIRRVKRELGLTDNVAFYDIYASLGQYRKAMRDYMTEEKKELKDDDYYGLAIYNNTIGNYLRQDKSTPTALSYFKKAEGLIKVFLSDVTNQHSDKEIADGRILNGIIIGNIGKCHVQLGEYEKAIPFLEESREVIRKYNKSKFSSDIIENTLALAECYLKLDDYAKATDYLSDEMNPIKLDNILKRNRIYADYYFKTGDYQNSTVYLKKNIRIRDSIDALASNIKNQQLTSVIEQDLDNSKKTMEQQKAQLEASRKDIKARDDKISLVFVSLIFTLIGFAGLVYAYLKSIKNQRLIAEQKFIIENSLVEKDSLLKEIHHRVKNNLQMVSSLLSLQTKNTRSKAAIAALEEGKSRVKAMALIHQKLYQNDDLSVIEMQGYIESLINSIQSVYKKGGHNINITIDAEGVELDIDRAIPFGLILNELVSNSFKYAFPHDDSNGKIYIHLRKIAGQEGFFEYTDNGIGLPEDTDERANSSMGIRLMNRLANQLQTSLNTDKTNEGVRFWFNFK